jgi:hypothetical protein
VRDGVVHGHAGRKSKACNHVKIGRQGCRLVKGGPLVTFTPLTDLLYTVEQPSSISLSPSTQMSKILAPSTHSAINFLVTWLTMSAATY